MDKLTSSSSDIDLMQSSSEETTLNSRGYTLIRKLGEGSYARVFMAEYSPAGTGKHGKIKLACKIIDTAKAPKDFVMKFLPRELDIILKLNHPYIVHVHSILQRRTKYFIFMRFAENGDLLDYMLRTGVLLEGQSRVWFRQMALAIQYIHSLEIAHRDLKCENVLITANYNVKLADFGFARYVVDSRGKKLLSETYCGSLSYAAPEILRGFPYNPKMADIWSLGVILYVMLNRCMPFEDSNVKKLYEAQMNHRWKFRAKVENTISEQAKKLVVTLLEPDTTVRASIAQIINSEWIAMDQRLLTMSEAEKIAVISAQEDRKKYQMRAHSKTSASVPGKVDLQGDRAVSAKRAVNKKNGDVADEMFVIKFAGHNPNQVQSGNFRF